MEIFLLFLLLTEFSTYVDYLLQGLFRVCRDMKFSHFFHVSKITCMHESLNIHLCAMLEGREVMIIKILLNSSHSHNLHLN